MVKSTPWDDSEFILRKIDILDASRWKSLLWTKAFGAFSSVQCQRTWTFRSQRVCTLIMGSSSIKYNRPFILLLYRNAFFCGLTLTKWFVCFVKPEINNLGIHLFWPCFHFYCFARAFHLLRTPVLRKCLRLRRNIREHGLIIARKRKKSETNLNWIP